MIGDRRPSGGVALPMLPYTDRREFSGAALVGLGGLAAFGLGVAVTYGDFFTSALAFALFVTSITLVGVT